MERVTGIGGFFFRAQHPEQLSAWYLENLGINPIPEKEGDKPWTQEAGATAFCPFSADSEYFGDQDYSWILNFRVQNLDAMVAQLKMANIAVTVDTEVCPFGRFARLNDSENNPIELWEPT